MAVGDADVAPHLGMAAGDAREIAEAAGGETEQLVRIRALREVMYQGKGQQVRQVADGGEDAVVLLRSELRKLCAAEFPARVCALAHRSEIRPRDDARTHEAAARVADHGCCVRAEGTHCKKTWNITRCNSQWSGFEGWAVNPDHPARLLAMSCVEFFSIAAVTIGRGALG